MKIIKIASTGTFWHISNYKFDKFDSYLSAQGVFWFAKDRDSLASNWHGANISSLKPIWLYEVQITHSKTAGWDEYDRYYLQELEDKGYDSIELDDNFVVFDPNNIEIINIERLK
jgi:hypothetical protein